MGARPARENQLSEEEIVAAALRLALRDGLDHLTMRGLAAALGVTPMAAYHYVPSKEALLHLVVSAVMSNTKPIGSSDAAWEDELRRYALQMWEELRRYPGVGTYLMSLPDLGATNEGLHFGQEFFTKAGFAEREAALAYTMYISFLFSRLTVADRLHGRKNVPRAPGISGQEHFEFGLETMIAGFKARLAASAPAT